MFSHLTVFAAFGSGGKGSCSFSAVSIVHAAARAGAQIKWWAGGLPPVSLKQRLALRSVALARYLARRAAQSGVNIYAFCVGFSPTRLPPLTGYGRWIPVKFAGHTAFSWVQH